MDSFAAGYYFTEKMDLSPDFFGNHHQLVLCLFQSIVEVEV